MVYYVVKKDSLATARELAKKANNKYFEGVRIVSYEEMTKDTLKGGDTIFGEFPWLPTEEMLLKLSSDDEWGVPTIMIYNWEDFERTLFRWTAL